MKGSGMSDISMAGLFLLESLILHPSSRARCSDGLMLVLWWGDRAHPSSAECLVLCSDGRFPGLPPPEQGPPMAAAVLHDGGAPVPWLWGAPCPCCCHAARHHIPPPGTASHRQAPHPTVPAGRDVGRPPCQAVPGWFRWLSKEPDKKHNKISSLISTNPSLH